MKKKLKSALSLLLCMIMVFGAVAVGNYPSIKAVELDCLEDMTLLSESHYTGNEGDSRVFNLNRKGLPGNDNKYYRNGNVGLDNTIYNNGFEVWIARWNFGDKISWASATFDIGGKYNVLTGRSSVIRGSRNTDSYDTSVYFYNGESLLYSLRLTPDDYEKSFEVNVSGVSSLTLMVKDNKETAGGTSFALYDLFFDKSTVKSSVGDIITFGSYPQSEVTKESDSTTYAKLEAATKNWISYGYYSGNGDYGSMKQGDWMKYADITLGGEKYRAVRFTQYRPYYTYCSSSSRNSYQNSNGYTINNIYYFKYAPLQWQVLDPKTGFVLSKSIIDSQAYSNTIYSGYTNDAAGENYANNYATSSIRKWLNEDFYNTAFTSTQKQNILPTTLNNKAFSTSYSEYDSVSTTDNVFLLSYSEAQNASYGFTDSEARKAVGTDYAKAQGLWVSSSSHWRLRSAGDHYSSVCKVNHVGDIGSSGSASDIDGIRPALRLSDLSFDNYEPESKLDITNGPIFIKKNEEYLISSNYYLNDEWQQAAEISWSSSDTSAAQIVKTSTGFGAFATVKGIADGISTITATAPDGKTASCDIVVGNSMPYLSVETSSKELNIPYEGGKFSVISLLPGFEVGNWTNGFSGVYSDANKAKMTAKNVSLKIDLPDGLSFNKNSSQKSSTILNLGELTPGEKVNTSAEIFIYDLEARQNQIYMTLTLSCSNARLKVIPIKINIYEKGGKPINDMSPASIASDAGEKTINNNVETDDVMINKSTGIINVENAVHSYKDKLIVDGGTYCVYSDSTVSCSQIIVRSGELYIDGSIDADSLKVEGGEVYISIDSNNRSVKIGEVKATGGVITINKGKFYADSISLKCRGLGTFIDKSGGVIEQNGGDIICKYDFLADSNLTSKLTAGRLWIGGDFKQTNSRHNFKCSDSHTTIFYGGGSHKINFDKTSKGNSYFHNCIVDNMYESKRDLCDYVKGEFRTAKTNITGLVFSSDGIDLNPVSKWEKGIVQLREQVAVIEMRQDSTLTKIYDDDTLINLGQTVNMWLKLISSPLIKSNFDSVSEIGAEITFKNFEKRGYDLTFVASGASFGWWGSFSEVSWYCPKLGVPEDSPHVIGMLAVADTETFKNQAAIYLAKGAFSDLKSAYKKNAKKLAIEFAKEITADDYIEYTIEKYDTQFKALKTVSKYHKKLNKSPAKSLAAPIETGIINYGTPIFTSANTPISRSTAVSHVQAAAGSYGTFVNAVKAVLNMKTLDEQAVSGITSLDLSGCGIIDLEGIEKFTGLKELILRDNYISDVSPLSNLKNLEILDLSYNNIKEVSGLSEIYNLQQLNLSHNRIVDISSLSGVCGIYKADFSYNSISDFDAINYWGGLEYLDISGNNVSNGYMSVGSPLKEFYADNCGLKSIGTIVSKSTVNISVVGNELTSLGNGSLDNLERANFSNNQISDISALKNSKHLISLDLSNNALTVSAGVFNLDSLEVLNISGNALTNAAIIKNAPKLKTLNISENPLASIVELENNGSVITFCASGCGLTDNSIVPVKSMKALKELDLSNNALSDASFVSTLAGLTSLDLTGNDIDFYSDETKAIFAELSKNGTTIKEETVNQGVSGIEGFTKRTNTYVSDKFSLSYFIYPSYAVDQRVIWSSSNNAIADVNSEGYVTAKAAGEVIITATAVDGGYSAKWTLNIEDKYCEVKWIVDGNLKTTSEKVGGKIKKPANPELDGYIFKGWSPEVPETMPAHDMTFTAVFEPIKTKISIRTPSTTTVSYGFTLNLHANVTDMPDGARVVWSMDGSGFELIPSADGMTCGAKSVSKGSATITAKVVDKNGNTVKDVSGNEITASQQLTSKAGFFQKLAAFFKKLFGSNMIIPYALEWIVK